MNTLKKTALAAGITIAMSGSAGAYTVTTFSPADFPYTEYQLGIDGMIVEDFEDDILASGLSVWFGYYTTEGTRQFTAGDISNNAGLAWDGSHILTHDADQYSTFFKFDTPVRSFGVALSNAPGWIDIAVNNDYSHYVHDNINGFSGFVTGNDRNLYYRIDAEAGDPDIKFIRFDTGGSSFGSPDTYYDMVAFGVRPLGSSGDNPSECTPVVYSTSDKKVTFDTLAMELYNPITDLPNGQFALFTGADMRLKALPGFYDFKYEGGEPVYADKIVDESDNCYPVYSSREETVHFPKIEIPLVSVLPNGKIVDGPSVCYEALLREANTQRLVFTLTEVNEASCE